MNLTMTMNNTLFKHTRVNFIECYNWNKEGREGYADHYIR